MDTNQKNKKLPWWNTPKGIIAILLATIASIWGTIYYFIFLRN